MKNRISLLCKIFACAFIAISISFTPTPKLALEGTWTITEVQTVKSDGSFSSVFPTESMVIFTKQFYSFTWTSNNYNVRSWQLPDSIKIARLNQSIINTGSYELKDSILTTKASFAMNPMFVNGLAKFKCAMKGDTLLLTGLSVSSSENIPNPLYAAGSHIVNKMVRVKGD